MLGLKPERLHVTELTNLEISICGKSFVADMSGALFWPSEGALIVSDLDLAALDTASSTNPENFDPGLMASQAGETLNRLASVIDKYQATRVIALGNGVSGSGSGRPSHVENSGTTGLALHIDEEDLKTLSIMQNHCSWIWVCDGIPDDRCCQGGETRKSFFAEGLTLCHRPTPGLATHEIAGALRPAARVSRYGHELRRPCFIVDGLRAILPAFATFAGGRNILGDDFEPIFGARGMDVLMLGHDGLYSIAPRLLIPD